MLCSLLASVSIMTGVCADAKPQIMHDTPPTFSVELAQEMINKHRVAHGLRPVTIDKRLMAAAKAHSRDMARRGGISHKGSDGSYPKDRARRFGYRPRLASENVAAGHHETKSVIRGWERSSGHNANLLRRGAKHMGMALHYDPKSYYQTYWTLLMGVPKK